jgi:DNA-binding transcriptional ArsR family regulator
MRAFSDGTRLRILSALARRKLTVGDLTSLLKCPHFRVSRHLRYLHARGVVECGQKPRGVLYSLAAPRHELHASVLKTVLARLGALEDVERDAARLAKLARAEAPA